MISTFGVISKNCFNIIFGLNIPIVYKQNKTRHVTVNKQLFKSVSVNLFSHYQTVLEHSSCYMKIVHHRVTCYLKYQS
jgi:hypothetical protein